MDPWEYFETGAVSFVGAVIYNSLKPFIFDVFIVDPQFWWQPAIALLYPIYIYLYRRFWRTNMDDIVQEFIFLLAWVIGTFLIGASVLEVLIGAVPLIYWIYTHKSPD